MSVTEKDLEHRLEGWLDREAKRVGSGESFAPGAYILARRRRFRKRIGAAVTSVAVVAALLPAGLWLGGVVERADGTPDVANTVRTTNAVDTPDPRPSSSEPAGPVEGSVDVTKLRQGDAPRVPWYSNGVIHDGDQQLRLDEDLRAVRSLYRIDGGFAVLVDRPQGADHTRSELFLVRPGVAPKSLGQGAFNRLAVSNDGRRIAWDRRRDLNPDGGMTLFVADADGGLLHTKELVGRDDLVSVFGFLGSSVLLERTPNEALSPLRIWEPENGRISDWYDAKRLAGLASDGSAVAVVTDENVENSCVGVRSVPELSKLWDSCDFDGYQAAFSPDSRLLATVNYDQEEPPVELAEKSNEEILRWYDDHPAVAALFVRSARSGAVALKLNDLAGSQLTWESDDTVLLEVEHIDRQRNRATFAVVRCDLDGQCERTTDFRKRNSVVTPAHVLAR